MGFKMEIANTILMYVIAILLPFIIIGLAYTQYKMNKNDAALLHSVAEGIACSVMERKVLENAITVINELGLRVAKLEKQLKKDE